MLLNALRRQFFARHVGQFNKRVKREKQFVDYAHAKTILVLYESEYTEHRDFVNELVGQFTNDGKRVVVFGYVPKKMATSSSRNNFNMLDNHSLNFWKAPKSDLLANLEEESFDLLIDLTHRFCFPLAYLLLHANASCKVGGTLSEFGLLDMVVKLPSTDVSDNEIDSDITLSKLYESEKLLLTEIMAYLKMISSPQ